MGWEGGIGEDVEGIGLEVLCCSSCGCAILWAVQIHCELYCLMVMFVHLR